MIRELTVKNLALIEDLHLDFSAGFSVFTGETGAGKSILIGAIGLLLGERASSEMVRSGSEEAEVSGVFELDRKTGELDRLLSESGIATDGDTMIVRRTLARNGRNRIYVNQIPVPLSHLKAIGDLLVDFHGQHQHQSLLNPESAHEIVDALPDTAPPRAQYAQAYETFVSARQELDVFSRRATELTQKKELLEFQYHEIHALRLREGEEPALESELVLLSSTAERVQCVADMNAILSDESASPAILLKALRKKCEILTKFDPPVGQWTKDLDASLATIAELERFCGSYADAIQANADPGRIEQINNRIAKIQRLKKKFQCTLPGLLAKEQQLADDLQSLGNIDSDRSLLQKKLDSALNAVLEKGAILSGARKKATAEFDKQVSRQMENLGLAGGKWKTVYADLGEPAPFGMEEVEFHVQANIGEPFLPLIKTASGGEISRLMLAIKTVMARHDRIPILIFDEIDTGIGGMIAKEVAAALHGLSTSHQVICISHLHQIASLAEHHYNVYKETQNGRTVTRVMLLEGPERIDEIARMLGGDSEIARKHARELLRTRTVTN
jgi:DNA repair protein RecN (Recombination protein N)